MNFYDRVKLFVRAIALISIISITVSSGGAQPVVPGPAAPSPEDLTAGLMSLNARYQAAGQSGNSQLLDEFQSLAASRQQLLAALVESNPGAILRVSLPAHVRASFPAAIQAFLEQEIETQGQLTVAYEDGVQEARLHYFLDAAGERLSLHFAADPPENLLTGSSVWVHGVRVGDGLALSSGSNTSSLQTVTAAALPNTFGAQKTLVILVNFQDNTTQPWTPATAQSMVFTTASNFWLENSIQKTWITGDVAGWFTLPISSTTCDITSIQNDAKQAAQNAGYVLSNYNRFLYGFPQTSACGWAGYSYVGGSPSSSWLNGYLTQNVINHELGHALGLYHSHSLSCGSAVYAPSGCTQYEYGDYYETMGNSNVNGYSMDYNAYQRERLGWLNYSAQPPITSVSANGSYTIGPYETQDGNSKALKILQSSSSGTYYYVEFRQALGFDHYLSLNVPGYTNVLNGVVVHAAAPGSANSSELLNMNPASSMGTAMALDLGQTYTDSTAGITISPTAVSSTGATVKVTLASGTCTAANPAVSISPSQSQWVTAGSTVSFTISVTDHDSSACGNSSFNLAATVPSGWSSAPGSSMLTLSPGGSASTTLQVTSPSGTADGFYSVGVSATNAAATSYTASASATYVISTPTCTHANPAIGVSPSQSQGVAAGTPVNFTVSVTNNDTSACTASSFNLAASVPSGWSGALGSSSLSLSPGASASTTLQVTSPASAAAGSYNISASATNASAPAYAAPASATYVIAAPVTLSIATNQSSYSRGQTVSTTVTALSGSSPDAGAAVAVTITKANGSVVSLSGTTGSNGAAVLTYRLKKQDPTGTYQVRASTSSGGNSASTTASTTFTVK